MEETLCKIEETIQLLYQNDEKAGMEAVQYLIETFERILVKSPSEQTVEEKMMGISLLRALLEAYQAHDIMAMADCLEEKATGFVKSCFGERQDGNI